MFLGLGGRSVSDAAVAAAARHRKNGRKKINYKNGAKRIKEERERRRKEKRKTYLWRMQKVCFAAWETSSHLSLRRRSQQRP